MHGQGGSESEGLGHGHEEEQANANGSGIYDIGLELQPDGKGWGNEVLAYSTFPPEEGRCSVLPFSEELKKGNGNGKEDLGGEILPRL
jgi:hypothetical protein